MNAANATTTNHPASATAVADELRIMRFEIKELEDWRDSVGLPKFPIDENSAFSFALADSRDVIALIKGFERNPELQQEASRVVARNIAARRARIAELVA